MSAQVPDSPHLPPTPARSRERLIGEGIAWTSRWSLRWVGIALGAVLFGLIVKETWVILFPIALALVISTVLAPVSGAGVRFLKLPRALAAAVALLGGIALVVGAGFTIAPSVADQGGDIIDSAAKGLQEIQNWVQNSDFVSKETIDQGLQKAQEKLQGQAGNLASGVLTGVSALTNGVITLVITLILTFLFLKDGHKFLPWLHKLSGPTAGTHLERLGVRMWDTLGGFIRTQALVSLIDAVFIGIGLVLLNVPLAIPLAIITFFAGFIPIVGAFAAGSLAVLIALVSNGPTTALGVLAVIVAVQQLEGNVLSPWLQSRSMSLHPAVVLLSVTLFGTLFGITGAFLAVPVVAVLAVVVRYLDEVVKERALRPLPIDHDVPPDPPPASVWRGPHGRDDAETAEGSEGVRTPPSRPWWQRLKDRLGASPA